jgi:hypothetical protein
MNENPNEKGEVSVEKFSTVLKSAEMETIQSLNERPYELSLISNEFMESKNFSNISFDGNISNFSVSLNSLNKMRKRFDQCSSINNILSNDNSSQSKINYIKKKLPNKLKIEQKKTQTNKQLINSQKSFKNIIQNYLKKETKNMKTSSKPLFQKIQPSKVNTKESYHNQKREINRNSQTKCEEMKGKSPQLPSHTPLSFKTNLRTTIQTNMTSRNNIISPTTFLKVNLTKENILEKSRKGLVTANLQKNRPEVSSAAEFHSNKDLVSSNIFKTIISNLVTPNKKLPNKCIKPPATVKSNITDKKEETKYVKKQPNNILGINNTANTTSFNNSKASSIYNINLNLNLNVNFNNSSKGSSSNTTLKTQNILNTNNSQSKTKVNDMANVVNLKENKTNIHETHITKKINSPKKEDFNLKEFTPNNDLPLTDRLKSPKENIFKHSNDKNTHHTIDHVNLKAKNLYSIKNYPINSDNKSNVAFVNKILNVKTSNQKSQTKLKEQVIKSVTPSCNNNSLNKLLKLNLDLKILDNKNVVKSDIKQSLNINESSRKLQPKPIQVPKNKEISKGIKIPNLDKLFDVNKFLSNNVGEKKVAPSLKLKKNTIKKK